MSNVAEGIDTFWRWWNASKDDLASAIAEHSLDGWVEPISENVKAMHPDLAWELGPGLDAQHQLCVTGEGNPELRVVTERWLARAPKADAVWEYHPARQPSPGTRELSLKLDGVDLDFDALQIEIEPDDVRRLLHITAHHPKLTEVGEEHRLTAAFLYLNEVLGEDDLDRFVGSIDISPAPLQRTASLEDLRASISELDEASESFTLLQGKTEDGMPILVMANLGLKRLDHLLMDTHVEIVIPYPANESGLYAPAVGEELDAMEDALLEALGHDAVFIGHETGLGQRVIHLHVVAGGPALPRIEEWDRNHPAWEIDVEAVHDPQWDILDRW